MECPHIDRSFIPNHEWNTPINYKDQGGNEDYIYYSRKFFGDDSSKLVQYCKFCGRKKDVFECLNESEWKQCEYNPDKKEKK